MGEAVASVVADVAALTPARLNLLVMNDTTIVASVFGDTLSALTGDGFTVVASEPYDDAPGWADVPEGVHTWNAEGTVEAR
jgi:glutamine amidotransferase